MPSTKLQVFVAEFVATFALCFVGVFSINVAQGDLVAVALAHGLTITVMIGAIGAISGAHINPAITFGFVATGRMSIATGGVYWIAQLAGASAAGFLLLAIIGDTAPIAAGTPNLGTDVTIWQAIAVEVVATFILAFVIFGSAVDERAPKSVFPFAIGFAVVLAILAFGPFTGAAMNPARHFGTALASGQWDNTIVYWVGPLVGGFLGAAAQHFILINRSPSAPVAEHGGPAPSEERH